jgi:hypothetical protein
MVGGIRIGIKILQLLDHAPCHHRQPSCERAGRALLLER